MASLITNRSLAAFQVCRQEWEDNLQIRCDVEMKKRTEKWKGEMEGWKEDLDKEKEEVKNDKAEIVMFKDRLLRKMEQLEEEKENLEREKEKGKKISGKDRLAAQKRAQKRRGVQPARAPLATNTTANSTSAHGAVGPGYSRILEEMDEADRNKKWGGKKKHGGA